MNVKTENHRYDSHGDIAGWDDVETYQVEVKNTRDVPVKVEIKRNFDSQYWLIARAGFISAFEKVDLDTVKFTIELSPRSNATFVYTVTHYRGTRTEDWTSQTR
jgi:hypothetical protein